MPAILRIDMDQAYESRKLNYARVYQELFPGRDLQGYLKSSKDMIKDLNDRGLKASLFFQPFTVPNKGFARELLKEGHSVGELPVNNLPILINIIQKEKIKNDSHRDHRGHRGKITRCSRCTRWQKNDTVLVN